MRIRRADGLLAIEEPPTRRRGPVSPGELDGIMRVLRIGPEDVVDSHLVDNAPGWAAVLLASARDVMAVSPELPEGHAEGAMAIGVVGPHEHGAE